MIPASLKLEIGFPAWVMVVCYDYNIVPAWIEAMFVVTVFKKKAETARRMFKYVNCLNYLDSDLRSLKAKPLLSF